MQKCFKVVQLQRSAELRNPQGGNKGKYTSIQGLTQTYRRKKKEYFAAVQEVNERKIQLEVQDKTDPQIEYMYQPEQYQLPPGQLSAKKQIVKEIEYTESGIYQGEEDLVCLEDSAYLKMVLTAKVYDVVHETELQEMDILSNDIGNRIYLKREDTQNVFSFKIRGAYNLMANLDPSILANGVVTASAGNHAQGVAYSAQKLGISAIICMPVTTPEIKISTVKRLGGIVKLYGQSYSEVLQYATDIAIQEKKAFIPPFDDPYVIAGQATIGMEILKQSMNQNIDAIFVQIGGGGLAAGIALYYKQLQPHVKIIGVEPSGSNCMAISLREGKRVTMSQIDTFADGVAVKKVGKETFRLCQKFLDGVVLVDNAAISGAIRDIYNETRTILEPSGALSLAGARAYLEHYKLKDQNVVVIGSGANINFAKLRVVSDMAEIGLRREFMLASSIPESEGSFKKFTFAALGDEEHGESMRQFTEFKYRYSVGKDAHILYSISCTDENEVAKVVDTLNGEGIQTINVSNLESAQTHLRHLVGGRARSFTGVITNEKICEVKMPERYGSLKQFLQLVSPQFNITLFHYRFSGSQEANILLGLQISDQELQDLQKQFRDLPGDFQINPINVESQKVFEMFIY